MKPIIEHFTDTDLYKLTMCCAVLNCYPRAMAKYKFVDRNNTVYPKGFADELKKQIKYLENLRITDEEIAYMEQRCDYIPRWFYTYLKGFKYSAKWAKVSQDKAGHLSVTFEGYWHETILLEVQVLAIISELYYIMNKITLNSKQCKEYEEKSYKKGVEMLKAGCYFSDFGTRRRFSFRIQEEAVKGFVRAQKKLSKTASGRFLGTSNVYLAMKYKLGVIGTCAHEWISAIAAMYGPQEANHIAMDMWQKTYIGSLGIYLYDTFTWKPFAANFSEHFARVFSGLRVDSGDNIEQLDKICARYKELGIDPTTKQVVFSNALDVKRALKLQKYAKSKCIPSFGIGTHFTNDIEGVTPMNIVIKLVEAKITELREYNKTCKMSEDKGKNTGDAETIEIYKKLMHI